VRVNRPGGEADHSLQSSVLLKYSEDFTFTFKRRTYRLGVSENRMLRIIFGPEREDVVGGWRRLHNENFITCTLRYILLR